MAFHGRCQAHFGKPIRDICLQSPVEWTKLTAGKNWVCSCPSRKPSSLQTRRPSKVQSLQCTLEASQLPVVATKLADTGRDSKIGADAQKAELLYSLLFDMKVNLCNSVSHFATPPFVHPVSPAARRGNQASWAGGCHRSCANELRTRTTHNITSSRKLVVTSASLFI